MRPALRIAIDGRSLSGCRTGVGTYTANLLENLLIIDSDLDVVLVTDGEIPDFPWLDSARVRISRTRLPFKNNFLWTHFALSPAVRRQSVHLFHSPGYTIPLHSPVPAFVTLHDISHLAYPDWYPYRTDPLRALWHRASARRADCILTVSEFSKREIVRLVQVPQERVIVTYPGIDRRRFRAIRQSDLLDDLRQRYDLKGDFLLFVGDIHRRRNVGRILEALETVRSSSASYRELQLVLVGRILDSSLGSPPGSSLVHRQGVRSLGYVAEEDLPLLYSLAKAFVFPSFYEGFGLGVLEAMACGCPVITGRRTACEEVAAAAALLVDPADTNSIGEAICALLGNQELAARCSSAALDRAAQFDWLSTAATTRNAYLRYMHRGRPSVP